MICGAADGELAALFGYGGGSHFRSRGSCRASGRCGIGGRMPGVWAAVCGGTEAIRQEI